MTDLGGAITVGSTARCGCCGRTLDRSRLRELLESPGEFICARCALWAARGMRGQGILVVVREWWERLRDRESRSMSRSAIPILSAGDLAATEEFYVALGFNVAGRYDGYLLLHDGPVELHFSQASRGEPAAAAGACFVHVRDAVAYWKQLRDRGVDGVSTPQEQDYGLVEFVVTDPSGNRVRFGSPAH
jgi:catechol 2,3-dioxygenase-like lactoylglutathione lyase family enzyme